MRESSTELLVNLPADSNTTDLLLDQHRQDPARALYAVKHDGVWRDISAGEVLGSVRSIAKGLIGAGVQPGDSVAVMSKTRYEWTLVDLAIWFAGGVTVPIYETSSAHQVDWILRDSGARFVFTEDDSKAQVVLAAAAAAGLSDLGLWEMGDTAADGRNLTDLAALGAGLTDEALERARISRRLDDVASIVYTSGTTGRAKGCEITHSNFALVAVNVAEFLPFLTQPGARSLMFLPLAHVLARAVQVICLAAGVQLGHTRDVSDLMDDFQTFQPTFLLAVPRIFEKIHASAAQKAQAAGRGNLFDAATDAAIRYSTARDAQARGAGPGPSLLLSARRALFNRLVYGKIRNVFGPRLAHAVSGSSPLSPRLTHFFRGAGVDVRQGYGLTETTAPATVEVTGLIRVGSVGIPVPGTTIRLDDDGEVLIKGIGVFSGYHNNPEANRDAFTDGFFRTGDLGEIDDDGVLTITGRRKDLLVTAGGKNVAPEPLEARLRDDALISEAIVVGEGRPFVGALITLDPQGLETWLAAQKLPAMAPSEAVTNPRVLAAVQRAVDDANSRVSRAEQIRKFALLDTAFSLEAGQLTPTLKLRRNAVVVQYADEVERLYA